MLEDMPAQDAWKQPIRLQWSCRYTLTLFTGLVAAVWFVTTYMQLGSVKKNKLLTPRPASQAQMSSAKQDSVTKDCTSDPPWNESKLIIAWTMFYIYKFEDIYRATSPEEDGCNNACTVSPDRGRIREARAVIFHALDVKFDDLPRYRSPDQLWVLFNLEPPFIARISPAYDNLFNLTLTYRNDSSLVQPYGYYTRRKTKTILPENILAGPAFRKPAYWLVSHCVGRRFSYVDSLSQHLSVDIIGHCSPNKTAVCNRDAACETNLEVTRAFYLSFENSECPYYITEKFWKILGSTGGAIPVVMGATISDYEAVAPPNSFIHVDNFTSPYDLSVFLKKVMSSNESFYYYHKWREDYVTRGNVFSIGFCGMCNAIHSCDGKSTPARSNLSSWFNAGCRRSSCNYE